MEQQIIDMLASIQADIGALLQAQQINNYLSLANNPLVSDDIKQQALDNALKLMGLSQNMTNEALPNNIIR